MQERRIGMEHQAHPCAHISLYERDMFSFSWYFMQFIYVQELIVNCVLYLMGSYSYVSHASLYLYDTIVKTKSFSKKMRQFSRKFPEADLPVHRDLFAHT
ncbi:hypothetical protein C0J52_13632 [Blattella germanica]|nr:hypothetical protein C0J52_13632 [Blattella germanica]